MMTDEERVEFDQDAYDSTYHPTKYLKKLNTATMKITNKEIDEMVADLREKGKDMLKDFVINMQINDNLVACDFNALSNLSEAMAAEIGNCSIEYIRQVHKQFEAEKLKGEVKRGYVLKDEIHKLVKTATSYSEIFNAINPLTI